MSVENRLIDIREARDALIEKAATSGDLSASAAGDPEQDYLNVLSIDYATPGGKETNLGAGATAYGVTEFVAPPEDPASMYLLYKLSAYVEPIIEALLTNVYKAGYTLKPIIPFDRPDEAKKLLSQALMYQEYKLNGKYVTPSDEAITAAYENYINRANVEEVVIQQFMETLVPDMSYEQLWGLTGQDLEVTGNGYWEIIRDTDGVISRAQWLSSMSMRTTKQGELQIKANKRVRESVLGWADTDQYRRFRKYAQVFDGIARTWFKELGDPRVMSRVTGLYYPSIDALYAAEWPADQRDNPDSRPIPATEILHWKLQYGGSSAYGKPRWSGVVPDVLGSRDLSEENKRIVSDESVPSLLMMISGGTVGAKSYDRIKMQMKERQKGRKEILILEANAPQTPALASPQQQPTVKIEKLKSEQTSDALFQNYDKRNEDKVANAWRMPRSILGKDVSQNRSTVEAMNRFAQDQIFGPKGAEIDTVVNNVLFSDLDILCWSYQTRMQQTRDPITLSEIIGNLVEKGILTPNEAREEAGQIFSKRLEDMRGLWTQYPPRILTTILQTKNADLAGALLGEDKEALERFAQALQTKLGLSPNNSEGVIDNGKSSTSRSSTSASTEGSAGESKTDS